MNPRGNFPELPQSPGDRKVWGNLPGSAMAHAIAEGISQHRGFSLVITEDGASARAMEEALRFFLPDDSIPVLSLPDWETLPYDVFSPHQDIISERLYSLYQLNTLQAGVLTVPVSTLMHRLAPRQYLKGNSLVLEKGQTFNLEANRNEFSTAGYRCVDTVCEHGEYAIRGSIVDIFPMGSDTPYRIDLFDNEIEGLRSFDPETQRTISNVESIQLLPAREFPLDKQGINRFRDQWHQHFDVDHRACPIYQDICNGIAPAGIEYYLPLFFECCESLVDYLPGNTLVFPSSDINGAAQRFWHEVGDRYEQRSVDPERPILPPANVFTPVDELFGSLKRFPRITASETPVDNQAGHHNFHYRVDDQLAIEPKAANPLASMQAFLEGGDSRVLFCVESPGRREALLELLGKIDVHPEIVENWNSFYDGGVAIAVVIAPLANGFTLPELRISVITEPQLFGSRVMQTRRRDKTTDNSEFVFKSLTELKPGAPVVHIDHGVGRYQGLQNITIDGATDEFLTLLYADDAKLYVPVASLHLISRYSGSDESLAPLHKLGAESWQKAKRKAAEKIHDAAAELLDIYARREARKGTAFCIDRDGYDAFAAGFPFEETPDQENAIKAVQNDMSLEKAMDRLVCGDVGFGKTEVALRAAWIAVNNNKQVAVLVPTTLLAQQHFETFRDRFADLPVTVEVLSRFRSAGEQKQVEEKLRAGKVDIVIGTHKLLQSGLQYKNLGLLIIDEEHRFGVRQKEKIKSLRADVDILTLTATPIPRTLNMAMSGIRDLSIIATPPARRLAVKTFVRQQQTSLVKEAALREILRGGQVYYLHNEVRDIESRAEELRELLPEARVGIAHGQMPERELEKVMSDFYHKRFNILLCTTIIETGIDVPNANTIIIERADKFGLAQLHQLRGRVGRSHHQAYAYLLTPHRKNMTGDALKRLEAIAAADDLGAGFMLANHDLEIRGAGELLGEEQSGQIHNIGFSLYMDMLERAVNALREGKVPDIDKALDHGTEINLRIPALIPDDYLPDVHNRLIMYKRIANAANTDELRELQVEMIDRFGLLPEEVKNLFRVTTLKLKSEALGIEKVEASPGGGRIRFGQHTKVNPVVIVKMVQSQPLTYRLDGATSLKFNEELDSTEQRINYIENLLETLASEHDTEMAKA
jgi:transcription-repair coupling factor (superfamily II helicase)